ncbi:MAG: hypothetical protein CMF96_09030 [Candidatus Marinimicrobia bacterium]|nr:hypothetical protein [Candidatus Neomarinimicrobiota bacterium]
MFIIFLVEINYIADKRNLLIANSLGLGLSTIGVFYSFIIWNRIMKNYDSIMQNSMLDGMTGLFTHKLFMERLDGELGRASRHNENLTLLFLDLDKFKRINDTYGHLFGDLVIKDSANIIKSNVRTHDVVARYGGEEYAVILVNTNKADCMKTVERIRENIENHIYTNNEVNERMTISIGMAQYPEDSKESRGLIRFADDRMYDVKKLGGNMAK